MRREQRLRQRKDFAAVRARGRGPANALLGVRAVRTSNAVSRVGFAVPKKVGTAVVRNRVRRRLRAIVSALPLAPGWDIVIAVRPPAAMARFNTLTAAAGALLARNLTPGPFPKREGELPRRASAEDGVRSKQRGHITNLSEQRRPSTPPFPP